jgi:hypothetical protein
MKYKASFYKVVSWVNDTFHPKSEAITTALNPANERRRSEWWSHLSGYECERVWEPLGDLPTITTALNPANERRRSEWWSHLSGSNRRPDDYKSTALPAELRWLGTEPGTRTPNQLIKSQLLYQLS